MCLNQKMKHNASGWMHMHAYMKVIVKKSCKIGLNKTCVMVL